MATLYPGSRYLIKANVGLAKGALQEKKYDDVLKLVQPLIDEANKKVFPKPDEARLYGEAFLVRGQAQEAKGDLSQALESYLTVVTIFYQNAELVKVAQQKADVLRQNNPRLTVS
jgi:predicted negative regulator of RcsB-dependent stress response